MPPVLAMPKQKAASSPTSAAMQTATRTPEAAASTAVAVQKEPPTTDVAASAAVAEVPRPAAVAATDVAAKAPVPPVSAAAALHVAAKAKSTVIACAIPKVHPVKEPQPPGTDVVDEKSVRRAAALRIKFRRAGGLVRIPVEQVGFHPANRDGQPPNGSRCAVLFKDILEVGFDAEEADNGGIVVEARPGSTVLHDFNKKACDGDSLHAPVVAGTIAYGSLSHSHVHQCLRNIRGGGVCDVPEVSELGKFSLAKLKSVDPAFGRAAETGLLWDVLSYAIEDEEPEGCAIIQSAMNSKNSMFLMRHEMQALAALLDYTYASAVAERALSLEGARRKLKVTCPEFAKDKDFLELYRYVIDLGSGNAGFLPDLRAFHERFVDPKLRRIHLSVFAIMNLFPVGMPYLKVAGIKYAYACDAKFVRHGFCEALTAKVVRDVLSKPALTAMAVDAEELLDFFHRGCWPAVAGTITSDANRVKFMSNIDKDVFGIVAGSLPEASRRPMLLDACGRAYLRMRQLFPEVPFRSFPHALPTTAEAATECITKLSPKMITYVDGKPVNQQDAIVVGNALEVFDWASHMETAEVTDHMTAESARSAIICALATLRQHTSCSRDDVHVLRGGAQKSVRVVAARRLSKDELIIAPLVRQPSQLMKQCTQGWAPEVTVRRGDGETDTMFMCVAAAIPQRNATAIVRTVEEWDAAESAVAENKKARFCDHDWKATHFMWPFWVVRRSVSDAGTNCKLQMVTVNAIHTGSEKTILPEAVVNAYDVTFPVMVNTKDVDKGDELVCHWPAAPAPKRAPPTYKVATWSSQAKRAKTKVST